jgi:hypothetical protein
VRVRVCVCVVGGSTHCFELTAQELNASLLHTDSRQPTCGIRRSLCIFLHRCFSQFLASCCAACFQPHSNTAQKCKKLTIVKDIEKMRVKRVLKQRMRGDPKGDESKESHHVVESEESEVREWSDQTVSTAKKRSKTAMRVPLSIHYLANGGNVLGCSNGCKIVRSRCRVRKGHRLCS